MLKPYPPLTPYFTHQFPVSPPHEIYLEQSGNPEGIPVVVVHGGPGAGSSPSQRQFFDPEIYHIILFDQRGCGKSTPHLELAQNNTQALIQDMEAIRHYLKIERWILFGGSWGSTLALVYAQKHPDRVAGLILRGIFLARECDLSPEAMKKIFPDYYHDFVSHIPPAERHNLFNAYYSRLTGQDEIARLAAAKAWSLWEARCSTLTPNTKIVDYFNEPHTALGVATLECYYIINKCFLKENQILNNMAQIQHIPGTIIHGRYDMVCPIEQAWELHQQWPLAEFAIVREAGHSSSEPGTTDALIHATQKMATHYKKIYS